MYKIKMSTGAISSSFWNIQNWTSTLQMIITIANLCYIHCRWLNIILRTHIRIMTSRSCFIPSITRYQQHHNCVTVYLSRLYQFHTNVEGTAEHIKYRNTDSCLNGSVLLSSMYCRGYKTNNYLRAVRSLKSSFTRSISTARCLDHERSSPYIHIPVMSLNNMKV